MVSDEARANFAALIRWLEEAEARHEDRQAAFLAKATEEVK